MKNGTFIVIKELKKRLFHWRLLAFIGVFLLIVSSSGSVLNNNTNNSVIARVGIKDTILADTVSYDIMKKLRNNNVKGVILDINSGGGDVVESEKLYMFFKELSKTKPVVSVINSIGASGAYMIAMASDYIISHNTSIVGSIGVIVQTYEITDLAKKIGVNLVNYKSSPLKSAPNPLEKINSDVDMVISQQINDVYDYFLNIFIERRKIKIAEAQEIANGQVYTGRQALEYGLVDKIGTEEDAIDYFRDNSIDVDKMNIVDFNLYKNNKFNLVNNFISSKIFSGFASKIMAIYNN